MINRRKAIVGYATFVVARRLARRAMRRKLSGPRPGKPHEGKGGLMLNKTKGAGAVAADRATALLETVRPIVTRAMSDPELHQALRNAFATGREVGGELSGKTPGTAAKKIARDRKLQAKVETAAQDLQKAVTRLTKKQKKERKRRLVKGLALLGAAAGAVVLAMRKFRGGGEPSA